MAESEEEIKEVKAQETLKINVSALRIVLLKQITGKD